MTVSESSAVLTLRAEEVGKMETHINVNHRRKKMGSFLVDHDWYAFCQALFLIEEEDWRDV